MAELLPSRRLSPPPIPCPDSKCGEYALFDMYNPQNGYNYFKCSNGHKCREKGE